jgi:hypothetical protein
MALSTADIDEIEGLLDSPAEPAAAIGALRQRFPHLTITRCDPSDVDTESPFRTWSRFALYLVDAADHCWRLTPDAARATGLVLVARKAAT